MPKYKKKSVVINAEQYTGERMKGVCCAAHCSADRVSRPHVHTIHNNQKVVIKTGDWIIPEPDGVHFYPCEDNIFRITYELAE